MGRRTNMTDKALIHLIGDVIRPQPQHRLIFAYDRNLDEDFFKNAVPDAEFVAIGKFLHRRLIVNSDGEFTLVPCRNYVVHGIVWEIAHALPVLPFSMLAGFLTLANYAVGSTIYKVVLLGAGILGLTSMLMGAATDIIKYLSDQPYAVALDQSLDGLFASDPYQVPHRINEQHRG
jgi:hypothetical protein